MSNSKLTLQQKEMRKYMLAEFFEVGGQMFNFDGFTVAIRPAFAGSTMAMVSVSSASVSEEKFRRKVGEFHALNKMDSGEFIQVPLAVFEFADFADNFGLFFKLY